MRGRFILPFEVASDIGKVFPYIICRHEGTPFDLVIINHNKKSGIWGTEKCLVHVLYPVSQIWKRVYISS